MLNNRFELQDGITWFEEPNYGCLGVITFPRNLTDAAGIKNSAELAEYLYKTCSIAGLPSGDVYAENSKDNIGIRINFSGESKIVSEAIQRLGYAIKSINYGITYDSIAGANSRGEAASSKMQVNEAMERVLREIFVEKGSEIQKK